VPALILFVGAAFLPDSPASLAARGQPERARAVLARVRGRRADTSAEWADIAAARDFALQARPRSVGPQGAAGRALRCQGQPGAARVTRGRAHAD
jgi:hypothetical protein